MADTPGGDAPEADAPDDGTDADSEAANRRRRRILVLLLTPVVLSTIAGFVATALLPTLVARHPLALIALDARNRHLVLAATSVAVVPYYTVAIIRLLAVDPFTYLLGRWYGDAGVRWIERRFTSLQPTVAALERFFQRAAPLAVAFAPGALMCTLAGATGMRIPVFFFANITGTVVRITVLRAFGDVFSGPVDAVRRFFDRYIIWTTAASIIMVVVWILVERRRGAADAETPGELADELEQALEENETGGTSDA